MRNNTVSDDMSGVRKVLLALAAILVAGISGGLVTWGGMQARVQSLESRQAKTEHLQLADGRTLQGLVEQIRLLREDLRDYRKEIREVLRINQQ